MPLVLDIPAQARLKAKEYPEQEGLFPQGIFALQREAQKFSVSPFSKGDDFGRLF
jgi:hypothetical protein